MEIFITNTQSNGFTFWFSFRNTLMFISFAILSNSIFKINIHTIILQELLYPRSLVSWQVWLACSIHFLSMLVKQH